MLIYGEDEQLKILLQIISEKDIISYFSLNHSPQDMRDLYYI